MKLIFLLACLLCASTTTEAQSNNDTAPATIQEHCSVNHTRVMTRVFYNDKVAIYFDNKMNASITWPNTYIPLVWQYVQAQYGVGLGQRLYVMFHSEYMGKNHPHIPYDATSDNRYVIDLTSTEVGAWKGSALDYDVVTHEIGHIIEMFTGGVWTPDISPAYYIWGDSKWADIFIYDVYNRLNRTADKQRWYNQMMNSTENFPRAGTQWFKNWFYPIYTMNMVLTDLRPTYTLSRYFRLLNDYFPRLTDQYSHPVYARTLNMGEFVHFWSGAVGTNLKSLATAAFGWTAAYENQFVQAAKDFPNLPYGKSYMFTDLKGYGIDFDINAIGFSCSNVLVDNGWNDRAVKVDTRGQCIRLYDNSNCGGAYVTVYGTIQDIAGCAGGDLSKCNFAGKASSMQRC